MFLTFIILLNLACLSWISYRIFRRQSPAIRLFFWPALLIKICAGLLVGYTYFNHYETGDTISYWLDGKTIANAMTEDPARVMRFMLEGQDGGESLDGLLNNRPRSLFFVKICGVLALLSAGNYWVMSVMLSFVSFLSSWYLFRKILEVFPDSKWAASTALLFFPSVVFWSSGIIKESLGLGSIFFLTTIFLTYYMDEKINFWEWIIGLGCLGIGWNLKYYWMGLFLPVILTTGLLVKTCRLRPGLERYNLILWSVLFIVLLFVATSVHPNFYPSRFFEVICQNNQEFLALTAADNVIHYHNLKPTLQSIVANSPQALIAGVFRPFIWEAHDLLSLAAALENFVVLVLALTSLISIKRFFNAPYRLLSLAVMVYAILLATFLALSTPNFGSLSRYKIGFLPFLVFLILYKNPIFRWLKKSQASKGSYL